MEKSWADALVEGKSVKVEVNPVYLPNSAVPKEIEVRYWIDGKLAEKTFPNVSGG